ncbi:MAG: type II toxin-antitoxin system PemK/MazF family toxin [Proteobacteria bacterium]|nr:type II toxin-antitoxin system PemK/MazF family toxin [Pseudomonadota bacterium]MBU1581893.1 type II toxin-antitoxin system PemK/MazF family toxin [Pseudomonadota bacterium]MBU2454821.1 type II toxin-antitoxin system PemK/MazF family toxin [Pseudomonadota bacterium]MBU2630255.1 type II toxin-antitoxin system PemK/MazF family toxin [Pseudomonadota bacterium]
MNISRGDIFLAGLDPVIGHEIAKTRPVIVVSNDIGNQYSTTVTVIPVTSKNMSKIYPFEIYLPQEESRLEKNSKGKADQIRTIDKARLIKPIGKLTQGLMGNLDKAIGIHLNLDLE